jgi:hypothetical protein
MKTNKPAKKLPNIKASAKAQHIKTVLQLEIARKHISELHHLPCTNPYHYDVSKPFAEGQPPIISVIKTDELYGHVQTAAKLGHDTKLEANDGQLRILFVEKMPNMPIGLY